MVWGTLHSNKGTLHSNKGTLHSNKGTLYSNKGTPLKPSHSLLNKHVCFLIKDTVVVGIMWIILQSVKDVELKSACILLYILKMNEHSDYLGPSKSGR